MGHCYENENPSYQSWWTLCQKVVIDAAPMLDFFPSDECPEACAAKMLPVWLPRSFINTEPKWTEDDMDSIQDLFYLLWGCKQPFKEKVLKVQTGPMHHWLDVSDSYPDRVAELEEEAQSCAKRIIEATENRDCVDGDDQPQKRGLKVMKFLSKFIETAAATVAMVVTLLKIWDEVF
ncbi:hypothetical protein RRG08_062847 [Elysia crispata]|uniref:Uncharacterized protein n=1 Tax=Elysia crispata TaxID=231223 RepID=A0AAE1DCE7_9GAST|nr:hypothetical protein RRG08_062847 [Elysia crispata]